MKISADWFINCSGVVEWRERHKDLRVASTHLNSLIHRQLQSNPPDLTVFFFKTNEQESVV